MSLKTKLPVLLVGILAVLTFLRNEVWSDRFTLWNDVISKSPAKSRVCNNIGYFLYERHDYDAALIYFQKAISFSPYDSLDAFNNIGKIYTRKGDYDKAIDIFSRAISIHSLEPLFYANRGLAYAGKRQLSAAIADYNRALSLGPHLTHVYADRGKAYLEAGDRDRAAADFKTACGMGDASGCFQLRMISGAGSAPSP